VTFNTILGWLVVAASTTLGGFILACGVDIAAGVALSVRNHTYNWNKLPSWLSAQFATREFLGVVSLGATAGLTALASTAVHGGLTHEALLGVAQIALAAMTAGAAAMMASVLKDARDKVLALFGGPEPAPAPLPPPIAVVVVPPPPST
jgi:hypothetical protein